MKFELDIKTGETRIVIGFNTVNNDQSQQPDPDEQIKPAAPEELNAKT